MNRYYLFKTEDRTNKEELARLFNEVLPNIDITFLDDNVGYFLTDSDAFITLDNCILGIMNQIDARITIVVTSKLDYLSSLLLDEAYSYYPGRCVFLTDIMFKQFSHGNFSSLHYLKDMFRELDQDILETAGAYLRSGMEGILAAKTLNIHRNTFNYRLNEFISKTGLDIRDYHNALLLEIYFQYCQQE